MVRFILSVFLATVCLVPTVATGQNLIELRVGGFITATDPDDLDQQLSQMNLESSSMSGFNIDVFINIPLLPVGAGLRYEKSGQDLSIPSGDNFELDVQNISLLIDWRVINNKLFYVGPLFTLGYPTGTFKLEDAGEINTADIDPSKISVAIAAEAGLYLGSWLLSAEVGYTSVKLDPPGFFELAPEINMSGFFGRLQVGIGILSL